VEDLKAFGTNTGSGHSSIMRKQKVSWQDTETVLRQFATGKEAARPMLFDREHSSVR